MSCTRVTAPAGICNGASVILQQFLLLLFPSPLLLVPSLSVSPRVKLAPLKDYSAVPDRHMLSVCADTCAHIPVFPHLMPPIARSQSVSTFQEQKQKERGRRVCVCVCASCRRVRHETGPDGHLRQSRLGLFTCFTLGHVSFVFSLAATRIKTRCQKSSAFISPPAASAS